MYRYPAAGEPPDFREHGISERDSGHVGAELEYELPTPTSTPSSMVSKRTRQAVATVDIERSTRGLLKPRTEQRHHLHAHLQQEEIVLRMAFITEHVF